MRQIKILMLLVLAAMTVLSSCGDDDEETVTTGKLTGEMTFSGKLTTKVSFNPESIPYSDYTSNNTDVKVKVEEDGSVSIVVSSMTARPAEGETPASIMTDITIKKVIATRLSDGSYQLSVKAEDFVGIAGGTMNGKFSAYKKGTMTGSIKGNTLTLAIDGYKFTDSPYEPSMKSDFSGTKKQ